MRRILSIAVLSLVTLAFASTNKASAGLLFNETININLSTLGIGLTDVGNVGELDFFGSLAINGSDTDGTLGFSVGDTNVVVGMSINDGIKIGEPFGSPVIPGGLTAVEGTAFQVTGIVREWQGTVNSIIPVGATTRIEIEYANYSPAPVVDENAFPAGTGFVDLYLQLNSDGSYTPYSSTDAAVSADGIWIGTFGLTGIQSQTSSPAPKTVFEYTTAGSPLTGAGFTRAGLVLVAAPTDDLWTTLGGDNLLGGGQQLATFIASTESPIPNPAFTNITGELGPPLPAPVNIGPGFNPPSVGDPGNFLPTLPRLLTAPQNTFATVPEPSRHCLALPSVVSRWLVSPFVVVAMPRKLPNSV